MQKRSLSITPVNGMMAHQKQQKNNKEEAKLSLG